MGPDNPPRDPSVPGAPPPGHPSGAVEPAGRLEKDRFYRHLGERAAARPAPVVARRRRRPAPEERGRMVVGTRLVARFDRMGPDGEALATVDGRTVAVPYAAPGDEATIRLVDVAPGRLRGRLVALRSSSARLTRPPCPHFGRCGGCQWQHLDYRAQLDEKTRLVRDTLEQAGLAGTPVDPAVGWEPPWEFRTRLEAAMSMREGRPVVGFFTWGGERIVDVRACPVQQPGNLAALAAVRAALGSLAPAIASGAAAGAAASEDAHRRTLGRAPGHGILRGLVARTGAATGEVLLGLCLAAPLGIAGRAVVVRALLDRVPGLVGILEVRVPRRSHLLGGRRARLLWGRPYVRDEAAGVRYHVPLLAQFPSNARAFPGIVELVLAALDPSRDDTILEPGAGIGAYSLQLALAAGRVAGVTDAEWIDAARDNARLNRIENCAFYTRDPAKALEKVARRWGAVRLAFLHPGGAGLPRELPHRLRLSGVRRVVYLGQALGAVRRDAAALAASQFRITRVQPIDTSPHTSRLAVLLTAVAG